MVAQAVSSPALSMTGDPLVVVLDGTLPERAAQYAEAVGPYVVQDPQHLHFWAHIVERVFQNQLPHMPRGAHRQLARMVQKLIVEPLYRQLPDEFRDASVAYARAMPRIDIGDNDLDRFLTRSFTVYDALNVLSGLPLGHKAPAGPLGCSSLVALSELTASGEVIHGRNLDLFPHANDQRPVIAVHRPHKGLKHISIHHAGGFTPGITSTNEAGLTLGVHQNFTKAVGRTGGAVTATCWEIIERCKSVSDALDLLRTRRTAGGWTLIISDAQRKRAVAVETDVHGAASLFPPRDFLAVANCYRTRKKNHDFAFTGAWREHNWSRLSLLNESARKGRGRFSFPEMQRALGDGRDAYDKRVRRAYGNTVRAIHNLDAVMFAPGLDRLYIAVGHSPRNDADGYVGYRLSDLFAGRDAPLDRLAPLSPQDHRHALNKHSQACQALFNHGDKQRARRLFLDAAALDPDEPLHTFLAEAMAMTEGQANAMAFEDVASRETSPYRAGLASLMAGRAHDLLGARREARAAYRQVAALSGTVDPGLHRRASDGLRRPYTAKRARGLVFDTCMGDVAN